MTARSRAGSRTQPSACVRLERSRRADPQARAPGGFPGASPDARRGEISFTGTDTLRIENGKLAEYWADADSLLFFQQLGVAEVPALA